MKQSFVSLLAGSLKPIVIDKRGHVTKIEAGKLENPNSFDSTKLPSYML